MKCKVFWFAGESSPDDDEKEVNNWLKEVGHISIIRVEKNKCESGMEMFFFYAGRKEKLEELKEKSQ